MKFAHLYFLIAGLLLTNVMVVNGQQKISGIVLNDGKEPIENASVFLNNTSYSAFTTAEGTFSLEVPDGSYELVVYQYGYSAVIHPLVVDQPLEVMINLKPISLDLRGQEVTADRDPAWYKNLEIFKQSFLGESRNGKACELINPTAMILDRERETGHLKGWATKPLLIRNKHLGYDISYVLEAYERDGRLSSYAGYVLYRDIPGLVLKQKHLKARERAYRGSAIHFVRTLIEGTSEEEGFQLRKFTQKDREWVLIPAAFNEILSVEKDGIYLQGSGRYQLTYMKEKPELGRTKTSNPHGANITRYGQTSELEFLREKVKLSASGAINPPLGIMFSGYMGWEKVGDAVPLDYQPKP